MTRRALLSLLAGAALDPERLLWRPGAKLISIPRPNYGWMRIAEIRTINSPLTAAEICRMFPCSAPPGD